MEDSAPHGGPELERAAAEVVRGPEINGHGDKENSVSGFVATPSDRLPSSDGPSSAIARPSERKGLLLTESKLMTDFAPQVSASVAGPPTAEQIAAAPPDQRPSSNAPPSSTSTVARSNESQGMLVAESKLMTKVGSQVSTPAAGPTPAGQVATAETSGDFASAKSICADQTSQGTANAYAVDTESSTQLEGPPKPAERGSLMTRAPDGDDKVLDHGRPHQPAKAQGRESRMGAEPSVVVGAGGAGGCAPKAELRLLSTPHKRNHGAEDLDGRPNTVGNGIQQSCQSAKMNEALTMKSEANELGEDEAVAASASSVSGRDQEGAPAPPTYEDVNGATKHARTPERNAIGVVGEGLDPSPSVSLLGPAVKADGTGVSVVQGVNGIHTVGNDQQEPGTGRREIVAMPYDGPAQLAHAVKSAQEEKVATGRSLDNAMPTEAMQTKKQACGGSAHQASPRNSGCAVGPAVQDTEPASAPTPVIHQPGSDVLVELGDTSQEVDGVDFISDDDAPDDPIGDDQLAVAHGGTRGTMASPTPMEAELSWVRDMQQTEVESDAAGWTLCESDEETEVDSDLEHRSDYAEVKSKAKLSPAESTIAESQRVAHQSGNGADEHGVVTAMDASTTHSKLPNASGGQGGTTVKPGTPDVVMALAVVGGSMSAAAATPEGYGQTPARQSGVSGVRAASDATPAATNPVTSAQAPAPAPIQPIVHPRERPGAAGVRPHTAFSQQQAGLYYGQMTQQPGGGSMLAAPAAAENAAILSAVFTAMNTNFTALPGVYATASSRGMPSFPSTGALPIQGGHAGLVQHPQPFLAASLPAAALGGYTHSLFQHAVRGTAAAAGVPATMNVKPSEVAQEKPAVRSGAVSSVAPATTPGKDCKTAAQLGATGTEIVAPDTLMSKNLAPAETVQVEAALSTSGTEPSIESNSEEPGSSGTVGTSETALVDSTVSVVAAPDGISTTRVTFHGASTPSVSHITPASTSDDTLPSSIGPPGAERLSGEGAPRSRMPITAAANSSALTGTSAAPGTGPIALLSASRAAPAAQRVTPAASVAASSAPTRKTQATSTTSRSSGAAAAVLPRRFSTRLASEQQSQDEIMQGLCMICLERLSDPAEGGSAKLLGLLDSCTHKYCHAVSQYSVLGDERNDGCTSLPSFGRCLLGKTCSRYQVQPDNRLISGSLLQP